MTGNLENGKGGAWWKPAVEIFSAVSAWIVAPIVLALFAGKALDRRFDSEPIFFLALAAVGFLITIYGSYKEVKKYMRKVEGISKNGRN